jgi:hypothetical protein
MSRYYLTVHGRVSLIPDEKYPEFETLAAAEYEAARTAADIGLHKLANGDACQAVVEVRDEHHQRVAIMTVAMTIDRLAPLPQTLSPWAA